VLVFPVAVLVLEWPEDGVVLVGDVSVGEVGLGGLLELATSGEADELFAICVCSLDTSATA